MIDGMFNKDDGLGCAVILLVLALIFFVTVYYII